MHRALTLCLGIALAASGCQGGEFDDVTPTPAEESPTPTVPEAPSNALGIYAPPYTATDYTSGHSLNHLYYMQPHNSYDHSSQLTNWLNAGYRTLEIDIQDDGDWEDDDNGPYVNHDGAPENVNCSYNGNDRLGHCLDDIYNWQTSNPTDVPLLVFIDMKASNDPVNAWKPDEVIKLDQWLYDWLIEKGNNQRFFIYSELTSFLNNPSDVRSSLEITGWPTVGALENQIIFFLTGGAYGNVNNNMDTALSTSHNQVAMWCPDIDPGDTEEITGTIDGMSASNSKKIVCVNMAAGDHHQESLNMAHKYKQILHIWGATGNFSSKDFGHLYGAVAHGASAIGIDVTESKTTSSTYLHASTSTVPLVGERRGLPGYFKMRTEVSGGNYCVDVYASNWSNGTKLFQFGCHTHSNQQFVYTAEGQLRPKGNNTYCLDIPGGDADNGDEIQIWDCDGGASEKWAIQETGQFKSWENLDYCLDVEDQSSVAGKNIETWTCDGQSHQKFRLETVGDWTPSSY